MCSLKFFIFNFPYGKLIFCYLRSVSVVELPKRHKKKSDRKKSETALICKIVYIPKLNIIFVKTTCWLLAVGCWLLADCARLRLYVKKNIIKFNTFFVIVMTFSFFPVYIYLPLFKLQNCGVLYTEKLFKVKVTNTLQSYSKKEIKKPRFLGAK